MSFLNICAFGLSVYHGSRLIQGFLHQFSDDHDKVSQRLTSKVSGLRQDVKLIECDDIRPSAAGINMQFSANDAAVHINKAMREHFPHGMNYFILRELYNIKQNANYSNQLIQTIFTGLGAVLGIAISNKIGIAGRAVAVLASEIAAQFFCSRADVNARTFALQKSNTQELTEALHIFEAVRRASNSTYAFLGEANIKDKLKVTNMTYDERAVNSLAKKLDIPLMRRIVLIV